MQMLQCVSKVYIFDAMGLQAYITIEHGRPNITFVLDNTASLKGMLVSARLLKLLTQIGRDKVFIMNNNIAIYIDKFMIICVLKDKRADHEEVKKYLRHLHDYISRKDPEDIDSFINALIKYVSHKYRSDRGFMS